MGARLLCEAGDSGSAWMVSKELHLVGVVTRSAVSILVWTAGLAEP